MKVLDESEKNTIRMLSSIIMLFGGIALLGIATLFREAVSLTVLPNIMAIFILTIGSFWALFPKPLLVLKT